jgi:hypothetical protein
MLEFLIGLIPTVIIDAMAQTRWGAVIIGSLTGLGVVLIMAILIMHIFHSPG